MKKPKKLNLVPEKEHGKPMSACDPIVVMARVIEVRTESYRLESIMQRPYQHDGTKNVTVEFEIDGETYCAKERFEVGQVAPVLGQWVRGVVVPNQWFSLHFVTTHLMKRK